MKEECYGFNPRVSKDTLGGKGVVFNETNSKFTTESGKVGKITNRFVPDVIKNPVSVKVDDATLRKFYSGMNDWNKKDYHYTTASIS